MVHQHYGSSDSRLVRSTSGRRISGDTAPRWVHRSRPHSWRRLPAPTGQHGHRRSRLSAGESWQIGSVWRECLKPCDRTRRAAPATSPVRVSALLPWGANSSLSREGRTHATTRPRARGRSRGGVRGSGWTSPSLRTTRSLKFSLDQPVGVDMSTSPDPRPRVRRRSIPANRVRHNSCGDVAVCRYGFTTAAHSRCPTDPIWRTTGVAGHCAGYRNVTSGLFTEIECASAYHDRAGRPRRNISAAVSMSVASEAANIHSCSRSAPTPIGCSKLAV